MKVAAIILAAGNSSRFGRSKQLVRLNDQALVRRTADIALEAKCAPVIVVVGAEEAAVRAEFEGAAVKIVSNPDWEEGIGSSIRAGIRQANFAEGVILLTCDQPLVRPETLRGLIELRKTSGKPIVASSYANTLGIPALFDRSCFADLLALSGDRGAKGIVLARRTEVAAYDFPEGAIDIDTPADFEKLLPSEKLSE